MNRDSKTSCTANCTPHFNSFLHLQGGKGIWPPASLKKLSVAWVSGEYGNNHMCLKSPILHTASGHITLSSCSPYTWSGFAIHTVTDPSWKKNLVPDSSIAMPAWSNCSITSLQFRMLHQTAKKQQLRAGWQEAESSHLPLSLSDQTEITHFDLISSS